VVLADLSFEALEVANQNIERHGLDERVYTVQGDGFDGLPGQRFDLIVSNPPYVDAEDFADMPAEYQHEPELGLACGNDGLNLVRRMLAEAADHLTEKGLLIVEVGNSQVHVEALYPEVDFAWLEFERGGHGVFMLTAEQCRQHQELFARVDRFGAAVPIATRAAPTGTRTCGAALCRDGRKAAQLCQRVAIQINNPA
jgi:ribosomal protein L3 glutamine methyltransferase